MNPGRVEEKEESMSVQTRVVGEVPGVFLERISRGDQEEVTLWLIGGGRGIRVYAEDQAEWRQDNRVRGRGKSNVIGTTYGSKSASKNL